MKQARIIELYRYLADNPDATIELCCLTDGTEHLATRNFAQVVANQSLFSDMYLDWRPKARTWTGVLRVEANGVVTLPRDAPEWLRGADIRVAATEVFERSSPDKVILKEPIEDDVRVAATEVFERSSANKVRPNGPTGAEKRKCTCKVYSTYAYVCPRCRGDAGGTV